MDYTRCRTDLPILLLYNLDPDWSSESIDSASQLAHHLHNELSSLGHPVELVFVRDADIDFPDTSTVLAAECDGLPYSQLGSLLVNLAAQRPPGLRE